MVFEGEKGESFIENPKTGFRVPIILRNGMYWIDTWIRRDGEKPRQRGERTSKPQDPNNKWSLGDGSDFHRPV